MEGERDCLSFHLLATLQCTRCVQYLRSRSHDSRTCNNIDRGRTETGTLDGKRAPLEVHKELNASLVERIGSLA